MEAEAPISSPALPSIEVSAVGVGPAGGVALVEVQMFSLGNVAPVAVRVVGLARALVAAAEGIALVVVGGLAATPAPTVVAADTGIAVAGCVPIAVAFLEGRSD